MQRFASMLPWQAALDDYESEVPTAPNADSDREPTLARRRVPADRRSGVVARRSVRALYVPSPLPMVELKKALVRADDEVTWQSAPALNNDAPPSSAPTRLHRQTELRKPALQMQPTPLELAKTSLAQPEERSFSSNVENDEAKANAKWQYPIPLPSLDEFAPIDLSWTQSPVHADASLVATSKTQKPPTKRFRRVALWMTTILLAALTAGIAHGDVTRSSARVALSTLRSAALELVNGVSHIPRS